MWDIVVLAIRESDMRPLMLYRNLACGVIFAPASLSGSDYLKIAEAWAGKDRVDRSDDRLISWKEPEAAEIADTEWLSELPIIKFQSRKALVRVQVSADYDAVFLVSGFSSSTSALRRHVTRMLERDYGADVFRAGVDFGKFAENLENDTFEHVLYYEFRNLSGDLILVTRDQSQFTSIPSPKGHYFGRELIHKYEFVSFGLIWGDMEFKVTSEFDVEVNAYGCDLNTLPAGLSNLVGVFGSSLQRVPTQRVRPDTTAQTRFSTASAISAEGQRFAR